MSKPILVVEDDEIARIGLSTILQSHGFDALTAANGREALELLQGGLQPALILLDMILPECDGWQFCAHLRDSQGKQVPVAIMTGLGIASEEWARSMGAVALLRKPLDLDDMFTLLQKYVPEEGTQLPMSSTGGTGI